MYLPHCRICASLNRGDTSRLALRDGALVVRLTLYPRPKLFAHRLITLYSDSSSSAGFPRSFHIVLLLRSGRCGRRVCSRLYISSRKTCARATRSLSRAHIDRVVHDQCVVDRRAIRDWQGCEGARGQRASPLAKAIFRPRTVDKETPIVDGDTIWQIDGRAVDSPEELAAALASGSTAARVRIYRVEWIAELEVPRQLLNGTNASQQLGISGWSRGHYWRATGFFNHWVTYSEALQLIASLALGIFLALREKKSLTGLLLSLAVLGLVFALGGTVTRASWIGFALSVFAMLLLTSSRRTVLIVGACAIPLVLASVVWLQQKRSVGFFDRTDQSTSWREMVWREGFDLLISKPRHLVLVFASTRLRVTGVSGDCLTMAGSRWAHAFEHFADRAGTWSAGAHRLVDAACDLRANALANQSQEDSRRRSRFQFSRSLAVGALGGTLGFLASGLVHYNWGDSEVVTIFYFIMGLCLVVDRTNQLENHSSVRV